MPIDPLCRVLICLLSHTAGRLLGRVQVALPAIMPSANGDRMESRVKMSRMRMRIAERLKSAQNTAAMLTTFQEVRIRVTSEPAYRALNTSKCA